jgi:hypothetical protein
MPSNDESQIDEREMRRRYWAARQTPELITTKQAIELFGRISFPNFKSFLSEKGIGAKIVPGFRGAYFYDKATIEATAAKYLADYPVSSRAGKKQEDKVVINTTAGLIRKLPETGWSFDDFLYAWSYDYESAAAQDIISRAPSLRHLSPMDAYDLIKVLLHLNGQRHRVIGQRYDVMYIRRAFSEYIQGKISSGENISQEDVSFVRDFIFSTYNTTDLGVFEPKIVVAVVFELRLSRNSKT